MSDASKASRAELTLLNGMGNLLGNLVLAVELGDGKSIDHLSALIRQHYLAALRAPAAN